MKPDVMDKLRDCRDFHSLTRGVLALCEPFGAVHAFRFVHNRGAERVACFIELESAAQQPALARALGCRAINGSVCLDIPVRKDFASEVKVVALAGNTAFEPKRAAVPARPGPLPPAVPPSASTVQVRR
jgi:hypothetical protein